MVHLGRWPCGHAQAQAQAQALWRGRLPFWARVRLILLGVILTLLSGMGLL